MKTPCPSEFFLLGGDPTGQCYPDQSSGEIVWYLNEPDPPVETATDLEETPAIVDNPPPVAQATRKPPPCSCDFPWMLLILAAVGGYYASK